MQTLLLLLPALLTAEHQLQDCSVNAHVMAGFLRMYKRVLEMFSYNLLEPDTLERNRMMKMNN
jgi:hypothetical protein